MSAEPIPFATVEEALEEIRQGRQIVLVDDEDRENEGDLAMAAEWFPIEEEAWTRIKGTRGFKRSARLPCQSEDSFNCRCSSAPEVCEPSIKGAF